MLSSPPDQSERDQALDVSRSFIVQAPAGSGKTTLLTKRFLALLEQVNSPEEILAITFTRKAAAEMQNRILNELPADRLGHHRLRIQTIDAFCAYIIRQMPLLSRLGVNPTVTEDADLLYTHAAQAVLTSLEDNQPWSEALAELLLHLDNDCLRAERLFIDMLAKRDQWLPYLDIHTDIDTQRTQLETALARVSQEHVDHLTKVFHQSLTSEQQALLPIPPLQRGAGGDFVYWHELATLLLTQKHEWRKRPAHLFEMLAPHEQLREALVRILHSPPPRYAENQWQILTALLTLLPVLVAHLKIAFQTYNKVDHAEIALGALHALGEYDNPSDLALALDYRIQHILIDEFQDTSVLQFQLLEKLTAGWQPNDGRTLFLVGDPMQSIYRFRKAEVGLFLRARQEGIGAVKLHPLTLSANFRSQHGIIEWVNNIFSTVLPPVENIAAGAVSYSQSLAIKPAEHTPAVTLHSCETQDEPQTVIDIIQQYPTHHVGILVRSRTHLKTILPALRHANIPYKAVDIDSLADRMVIQDLLAITRILLNENDHVARLAILRAPWCGLSLADLYAYTHNLPLTREGQEHLDRITPVLSNSIAQREHIPLYRLVEQTWLTLEGPAYCHNRSDLDDATTFFHHLAKLEHEQIAIDIPRLEKQLTKLYAAPDTRDNPASRVEIMSLHKSKGLEFDTVIMPGLGRRARHDGSPLLMWTERPRAHTGMDLLLAPISATSENTDPIYQYLRREESQKNLHEIARLLYVGATRARNTLHLLGHCEAERKPVYNSLLAVLWESIVIPEHA